MLCDVCGKNPATVHVTEIVNNQMNEMHLCEECAREKSVQMEQHFGLSDLLAGMADLGTQFGEKPVEEAKVKCANCGMAYEDFKKIGRLGCSECYSAFRKNLVPLLKRIHGSNQHVGSAPSRAARETVKEVKKKSELQELKEKLQQAIQREEFEEAARLRDKIRELEKRAEDRNKSKNGDRGSAK